MKLLLVDLNRDLCDAWRREFGGDENVSVHQCRFESLPFDAMVAAGNSFGLMDGGIDLAIAEAYPGIERVVQYRIDREWHGLLPVGAAVTAWAHSRLAVIYAPTMRVPMDVCQSDHAYQAMRAALVEARREGFESIAVPGLATGVGCMAPDRAAQQMHAAWLHVTGTVPDPPDWSWAHSVHSDIWGLR